MYVLFIYMCTICVPGARIGQENIGSLGTEAISGTDLGPGNSGPLQEQQGLS